MDGTSIVELGVVGGREECEGVTGAHILDAEVIKQSELALLSPYLLRLDTQSRCHESQDGTQAGTVFHLLAGLVDAHAIRHVEKSGNTYRCPGG